MAENVERRYRLGHLKDQAFVERYLDAHRRVGVPEWSKAA